MDDLRVLVFYYFVEAALLGFVGMALIGIRLTPKHLVQIGLAQGLAVYFIRGIYSLLQIKPGSHTMVALVCLVLVYHLVTRQDLLLCTMASILSIVILFVSEGLIVLLLFNHLDLTYEVIASNPWRHIAMGYCGSWLAVLVAVYLAVTKKSLFKIDKFTSIH